MKLLELMKLNHAKGKPHMPARPTDSGEEGHFAVIAVTCFANRNYQKTIRVDFLQRSSAYAYCDKLQDEIDADGHPARAYVYDKDGVPIRAGRSAHAPADYFFARNEPAKVRRRQ